MEHMAHTWNWTYIALSYIIAAFAAYMSLELASRAGKTIETSRNFWLVAQGFFLGYGIWSMHFVGMLAFEMPTSVSYDTPLTVVSGLVAVVFLIAAIFVMNGGKMSARRLLTAGAISGAGIVLMHYVGMAAMHVSAARTYSFVPLALSVLIAVSASCVALFLFSQVTGKWALDRGRNVLFGLKVVAGLVMGIAIVGMHYTGMAAVQFAPSADAALATFGGADTSLLGLVVLIITFMLMGLAVVMLLMDSGAQEALESFD
ncbi:MHYT domain-containing protein [Deinococcus yavapaiensis]|uniref:NO-binding membrane sensor protein with MHYT domain n=1 Tax=Deinococcus yavapaiensis KR-236 TaxID=694435 RepID=A0A318SCA5_9DEIO|nr:MHYT domain-containing protein [Deinococcus yavapaiensis]PYE56638.1 NO-binding membrane sensor protein with MHYT domain [Deinococcus yavapaiensis KR-236]